MRMRRTRRRGLTLIEMLLTTVIGMLLLLAVFMVLQTQYNGTQIGRESIQEATLARNILTRVGTDLTTSLGPVDPRFLNWQVIPTNADIGVNQVNQGGGMGGGGGGGGAGGGGAGGSGSGGMGTTSGTTGATGATGATGSTTTGTSASASSSSSTSSSSSSTSTSTPPITPVPYNLGVKGDTTWIVISGSRVPGGLVQNPPVTDGSVVSSDLSSLSIWFIPGTGLVRKEMTNVTSDQVPTGEPDLPDPQIIAREVKDIAFEYFDGVEWQSNWDGGQLGGSDGNTPIGPPSAIKITITMGGTGSEHETRKYTHVVALPASNAFTMAGQQGQGVTQSLTGQGLVPAIQNGTQLPLTQLTNPTPQISQTINGTSSSSSGSGSGTGSSTGN